MWISVHDTVDGPKLRTLVKTTGCSKGEAIGVLTAVWLWGAKNENADQSGRIRNGDEDDIADVIRPYLSRSADSKDFVEKMIEAGWIDRLDGDLYFHDWEDWQGPWYKYQREKARDTKRRREVRQARKESDSSPPTAPAIEMPREPPSNSPEEKEPEQPSKKPKNPPKPKLDKKQYAEFVTLTEDEYGRLVEKFGEDATERMVEILDNYKGQSGKKYASDYRAILNWVWERVRDENPKLIKPQAPSHGPDDDLAEIIPDEWRNGRG